MYFSNISPMKNSESKSRRQKDGDTGRDLKREKTRKKDFTKDRQRKRGEVF